MTATDPTADFLARARQIGALTGAVPDDLPDDSRECAAALVVGGHLTQFQADALLTGKPDLRLGSYLLVRPLGEGGMGRVYLARHVELGRQVAVKLLLDPAADHLTRERFRREARAAAALDHPNIVRLYDIRCEGTVEFLVLEVVSGIDLQRLLQERGPLPPSVAAGYIRQAAAGLAQAHERGIIHRDIKPANLMLTPDGTVKVLDLGLARSLSEPDDAITCPGRDGGISGTVDYLSPEQAVNGPLDARADVYGLGATLAALVTGTAPYSGTIAQKLLQHQLAPPPDLHKETAGRVPKAFAAVVARLMAKRPDDRPASAAEVVRLLAPWAEARGEEESAAAATTVASEEPGAPTVRLPLLGELPPPAAPIRESGRWWPRSAVGVAFVLVATALSLGLIGSPTATGEPATAGPARSDPPATRETVYETTFRDLGEFDHRTQGSEFVTVHQLPALTEPGWMLQGEEDGVVGLFTAKPGEAGATLSVAAAGKSAAAKWLFVPSAVGPDLLRPNTRYRAELEYLAESQGELRVQEGDVWTAVALIDLPAAAEWKTVAVVFSTPPHRDCSFTIRPLIPNGKRIHFRRFRIDRLPEPAADVTPVFAFTAADLGDFGLLVKNPTTAISAAAPEWLFGSFKDGGEAEFETGTEDGRRHLTLRNLSQGGAQAHRAEAGPPLKAGVPYRVTVEYRAAAGTTGCFDLRERDMANWADAPLRVYLPHTDGRWEMRHYEMVPPRDWPPLLVLQNLTADPGNEFSVRRLTVTECPK